MSVGKRCIVSVSSGENVEHMLSEPTVQRKRCGEHFCYHWVHHPRLRRIVAKAQMWMGNGWAPKNAHSNSSISCASSAVAEKWCEGVVAHKKRQQKNGPPNKLLMGVATRPPPRVFGWRACVNGEKARRSRTHRGNMHCRNYASSAVAEERRGGTAVSRKWWTVLCVFCGGRGYALWRVIRTGRRERSG